LFLDDITKYAKLNDKWNDGFPGTRIIFELPLVIAVLAERPNRHLVKPGHGK